MSGPDDRGIDLKELFFESAAELLQSLNEEGLMLEKRVNDAELIRQVRRTVHTLKGDSAACGYRELSSLAHELEDVLTPEMAEKCGTALAEIVLAAADSFHAMLAAYRNNLQPPAGQALRDQIRALTAAPASHNTAYKLSGRFAWNEQQQAAMASAAGEGLSVFNVALAIDQNCPLRAAALQLIKNVLQEMGTVLAVDPADETPSELLDVVEAALATSLPADAVQKKCQIPAVVSQVLVEAAMLADAPASEAHAPAMQPQPAPAATEEPKHDTMVEHAPSAAPVAENILRVEAERIDAVLNLVGELIIGKSMLHQAITDLEKLFPKHPLRSKFEDAMTFQSRVLHDLQKAVMKVRMVPVDQLFRRFPRVVRDVAKELGKEVQLEIAGQDTDLDKSILDALAEPLTHLVRNAVDHGLEPAAARVAAGKPAQGTVKLDAYHQGNQIVIEVRDDGRGIDPHKVIRKAMERGLVTADQAGRMSESEIFDLIFQPGFSTAEHVTSISGRGVGMDVVRTVLERLKGSVRVESTPGRGAAFLLKVPLTLAIIKALLFRAGSRTYAIPLSNVFEIARAAESEIHRVDQHEVMRMRGEVMTVVRLSRLQPNASTGSNKQFAVVTGFAERKYGLLVNNLIGEEELVIKALDDQLVMTDLVSGASILGDGTVVLILNTAAVITRFCKVEAAVGASA